MTHTLPQYAGKRPADCVLARHVNLNRSATPYKKQLVFLWPNIQKKATEAGGAFAANIECWLKPIVDTLQACM